VRSWFLYFQSVQDDEREAYWAAMHKKSRPSAFVALSDSEQRRLEAALQQKHEQLEQQHMLLHDNPYGSVLGQVGRVCVFV
jgi:hypothetical protein